MSDMQSKYQDPDEGLFQPSRAQEWGIEPFVIRPPTKDAIRNTWISADHFKNLDATSKRTYGRAFGVPRDPETYMSTAELDTLFTTHNEKLPMFIELLQFVVDRRDPESRIPCVIGRDNFTFEPPRPPYSGGPSDPDYAPWVPLDRSHVAEILGDSPDDFEDGYLPGTKPGVYRGYWADIEPEPEKELPLATEHDLVYPPYGLTVADEATGKRVEQPLSADWLRVMLDEQTARHAALQAALQEAMTAVNQGVTAVAGLQMELEAERAQSDNLLKTNEQLGGWEIPRLIEHRTKAGVEKGNIYANGRPPKDVDEDEDLEAQDVGGDDGQSEGSEEDADGEDSFDGEDHAAEDFSANHPENGDPQDEFKEDVQQGEHQGEHQYHLSDSEAEQLPAAFERLTPPPEDPAAAQSIPAHSSPPLPFTLPILRTSKRSRDDVDNEDRASGTLPASDSNAPWFPPVKRKRVDRKRSIYRPGDPVFQGTFGNPSVDAPARERDVFDVDTEDAGPSQSSGSEVQKARHSEIHRQGFDPIREKEAEDKYVDGIPESEEVLARRNAKKEGVIEFDMRGLNTGISYHYTMESVLAWEREHGLRPFKH